MKCPKCRGLMEAIPVAEMEVDRCASCRGLWFDDLFEADHIKKLHEDKHIDLGPGKQTAALDKKRDYPCPKCGAAMVKMVVLRQPHIHYESCSRYCGIFFDSGELREYEEETIAGNLKDLVSIIRNKLDKR